MEPKKENKVVRHFKENPDQLLDAAGVGLGAGTFLRFIQNGGLRGLDVDAAPKVSVVGAGGGSFGSQASAIEEILRQQGIETTPYSWSPGKENNRAPGLKRLFTAPKYDATMYSGHGHMQLPFLSDIGKLRYRLNSDFREGNFLNHPALYGSDKTDKNIKKLKSLLFVYAGGGDRMAVQENPRAYHRFFTPGTEEMPKKYQGKMPTKMIGNIPAISNFSSTAFQTKDWGPEAKINAILTTGGGNAIPQVFDELVEGHENLPPDVRESVHDPKYLKDKRTKTYKTPWRKYDINKRFFLDDILEQMRAKHGDNFNLKWLTGYKPGEEGWPLNEKLIEQLEEHLKTPEGQKRFKGLELQHRLPPTEMPNAFSNAHYIYLTPGSTSAEIMSMPGEHVPKVISVLPNDKPARYMKHFPINARELEEKFHGAKTWDTMGENRGEALRRILEEEHSPAVGRNTGYKTDTAGIGETIKKDIRANKIKNMKGLLAGAGLSLSALGAAKVLRIIKKHKEQREKEQNMSKISMLSEEFKKTAVKNKNNIKIAGIPETLITANNLVGLGYGAGRVGYGGYKGLTGHPLEGANNIGLGISALSTTPFVRSSLVNSPKAFSRLSAAGAPFAAAETLGNLKDVGADLYNGNFRRGSWDATLAGLNGSMAYAGAKQGLGTYRTAYNMAQPYLRSASNFIKAEAPNYINAAKGIGSDVANFARAEAPNYINAAKGIGADASNAISRVAPNFTNLGARAGSTAMPEIITGLGARAAALPGASALMASAPIAGRVAGGATAGYTAHTLLNMIPKANENTYGGQVLNNFRDTLHDIGTGAATGAGSFGPGGAIPGAVVGGVANLARQGYNAYQNGIFNPANYRPLIGTETKTKVLQNALNVNMNKNIAAHNASTAQPVVANNDANSGVPAPAITTPTTADDQADTHKLNPPIVQQPNASAATVAPSVPTATAPTIPAPKPPSEAMGGETTPNVVKMSNELVNSGLRRRNTGIGDWVNPKDFEYLSKSAAFNILTKEEYANLPLHPRVESIHEFFFPQG